ncbi:MAG: hypothetical protein GTO53_08330 [Planctomycetales bacterium]|nr:hypothetical protein [Planctomycetales bacterium]NIM09137.1 hypothetical protein [Planctomycetales bacterium]NIN08604.1 hypothetical protein [Planctomycetales bacterium]NIN77730.1 hypothetical protein [Planctomycetales bacterium]NIO34902.1 hypothetical protein [Planctomycetales bacterium]
MPFLAPGLLLFLLMAGGSLANPLEAAPIKQESVPSPRRLAPGVEQTIPVEREAEETSSIHDMIELTQGIPDLRWTPDEHEESLTLYRRAERSIFRRGIWQVQITFKPLRMIYVDLPQPNGKMKRELVWYMVYRITNPGKHLTPVQGEQKQFHPGEWKIERANDYEKMYAHIGPHRFTPIFLLRTHRDQKLSIDESSVEHLDQILPVARRAIYLRERPNCSFDEFYDSAGMSGEQVVVSTDRQVTSRYGVVTWIHVDRPLGPDGQLDLTRKVDVDFFTIQIMGLTNAYRWQDPPPGAAKGTGRTFEYKTLEFTFYRPGDQFDAREDEIRWGVPGHRRYRWVYRPAVANYRPHGLKP